MKIQPKLLPIS